MSPLRVIQGGSEATALRPDELPVPPSLLNPAVPNFRSRFDGPSSQNENQYAFGEEARTNSYDDVASRLDEAFHGHYSSGKSAFVDSAAAPDREYGRYAMRRNRNDEDLKEALAQPLSANTVAIVSRKGGVGTTTIAAHLAAYFAAHRPGAVAAVDGDASTGPLAWLLAGRMAPEFRVSPAVLKTRDTMSAQALRAPSGVEVLAAPLTINSSPTDIASFARALRRHFDTVFLDIHPQLNDVANHGLLSFAQVAVVVAGPNRDGARAAEQTLDWLDENGHDRLDTIVVINGAPKRSRRGKKMVDFMGQHFSQRAGAVVVLPLVEELSAIAGQAVTLDEIPVSWRNGIEQLAGSVVNRLQAHAIVDVEEVAIGESPGAELRVLPPMVDHDASDLHRRGGNVNQTSGLISPRQPTPAAPQQSKNEGE